MSDLTKEQFTDNATNYWET